MAAGGSETKRSELLQSGVIQKSNKAGRERKPHLRAAGAATAAGQGAADAAASSCSRTRNEHEHVYVHVYERVCLKGCQNSMQEGTPERYKNALFYNYWSNEQRRANYLSELSCDRL